MNNYLLDEIMHLHIPGVLPFLQEIAYTFLQLNLPVFFPSVLTQKKKKLNFSFSPLAILSLDKV